LKYTFTIECDNDDVSVFEYIWMGCSDEFFIRSGARQLLDTLVAYYCCPLSNCSAEWQCFSRSMYKFAFFLTYYGFICGPKSSILTTFYWEGQCLFGARHCKGYW